MHPDRRRHGRAIRKQRRFNSRLDNRLHLTVLAFRAFGQASAIAAAGLLGFGKAFSALAAIQAAQLRLDMIARTYAPVPITFERHDMTTVTLTAPSTAPWPLHDELVAFARDLHNEGIDVVVEIIRTCTICGCTDDLACLGGCAWVNEDDDLCTTCDSPSSRDRIQHAKAELRTSKNFAHALAEAVSSEQGGEVR